MEQVGKAINRALAQSSGSEQQPTRGLSSNRAAAVWNAMTELYGTAFVTAYGAAPSPLWLAAIERLSDDACRKGLTRLASEAREYPANLTQFVAACNYREPARFSSPPPTAEEWARMLPAPPEKRASREKINAHLENMRKRLRVSSP